MVTASAMRRRGVIARYRWLPKGRVIAMNAVAAPICRVASWPVGTCDDACDRAMRWAAKAIAQARVRRSPGPILAKRLCQEVPAGVVRRRSPENARRTPMVVVHRGAGVLGERSAGKRVKMGTKT